MQALSGAGWLAISGMVTAFIGGAFTLAGVFVSVLGQRQPKRAEPDHDPCAQCQADLIEMTAERDRWRAVAETFMPRRREDDQPGGVEPPQ